jgi:alkanesulfonate monooxygenase SsuD/methylene tetrahydromethanopterin reductase-like flavin-dependent oxidoreductase (luciferase family)
MKFLLITLITHTPDPVTGEKKSPADRLRDVLDKAVLAEELGFDGFAVGERHEDPFISSSPPVVLSNIAARTSKISLFTGVTTLSLLDPVRAFEDYATLDNLSGGRLELIIGKGNGAAQAQLFHRGSMGPQPRRLRAVSPAVGERECDVVGPVPAATGQRQDTSPAAAGPDPDLARQRDQ